MHKKNSVKDIEHTELKLSVHEADMVTTFRLLRTEKQALVLTYVRKLESEQAEKENPVLDVKPNIALAVPNSKQWSELCPYMPVSQAETLMVVLNANNEAAVVYEISQGQASKLYTTREYPEVIEIQETAYGLLSTLFLDDAETLQNSYAHLLRAHVHDDLEGGRCE